jgi:N-acetylmuramoyl-L-alanine amidase
VPRIVAALVASASLLVTACAGSDVDPEAPLERALTPSSTATTAASSTTTAPVTTTTRPSPWPALAKGGPARAIVAAGGIVLPVTGGRQGDGWQVSTPCGTTVVARGRPLGGAHVVIDPGHGGNEPGAVGPTGLSEKRVNLAVARELKRVLERRGATVVLTRTGDYRVTLATRGLIVTKVAPLAFVSVHHNAEPDGPRKGPGAETYYQIASPASKRLAGLIYEEVVKAFSDHRIAWVADRDAGAKYRPASDGGDYYGILRRSAGVPAVLSEAAFITNPPEEKLLASPEFRHEEAVAIANAIERFVMTKDRGSGYVEPYPRTQPAGPGGGAEGCVDPPL